ncbi:DUF4136 domain-containing protein [Alcaligenes nematophilus]|uniref:DUF4136 domain-containing protein n=1 Tax=Alcaligenes TaxID=507 RepID=UPI000759C0EE|nr:DUF4136 domain-containing protein [Alcaligenes faecalis]ASC89329.1 DUF4136 domain-containing protein [Alcaligenes faecalis]KVX05263.1 hypothetical protein ASL22_18150 [Alcaligenes faecalis]UUO09924.1 DUF4136 domain-containing protein [Alcaligenes faecalis]
MTLFSEGVSWRALRLMSLVLAVLTTACAAPSWSAKLTRYQQWPTATSGDTYYIKSSPDKSSSLQYQSFADSVRASIGVTGLVQAADLKSARFVVQMDYGNPQEQSWVPQFADSFYGPSAWGIGRGYYAPNDGWGGGFFYSPNVVNVPVTVYKNYLNVIITDNQNSGAEVYRATAVSYSHSDNLDQQMPFLSQAIFDGFPGNNGQVIDIRYPLARD